MIELILLISRGFISKVLVPFFCTTTSTGVCVIIASTRIGMFPDKPTSTTFMSVKTVWTLVGYSTCWWCNTDAYYKYSCYCFFPCQGCKFYYEFFIIITLYKVLSRIYSSREKIKYRNIYMSGILNKFISRYTILPIHLVGIYGFDSVPCKPWQMFTSNYYCYPLSRIFFCNFNRI